MFTGIVKEIGVIKSIVKNKEGAYIEVSASSLLLDMEIDDSVAINGACQTIIKLSSNSFAVQAVHTTLEKTAFEYLKINDEVNLELALRLSDRLGGHLVTGHINGMAKIKDISHVGDNYTLALEANNQQDMKYLVKEGSITLDGVSLTISDIDQAGQLFYVSLIPHTWANTIFRNKQKADWINYEVDTLAKYVENLLFYSERPRLKKSNITLNWLADRGF